MQDVLLNFAGLGAALQSTADLRSPDRRERLLKDYRAEIAALLIGFRNAQISGRNDRPMDGAERCDLCEAELAQQALYVDGRLNDGSAMWGNMCMSCYLGSGSGIGWGVGQLYLHDGLGWQCIGGGNPAPAKDEDQ